MSRRLAFTRPAFTVALLISAVGLAACQSSEKAATTVQSATQAQMTPTLSTTDANFINTVGMGGIAEVKFGELAQTRATRTDVRAFGAQMVSDHSAANNELTTLAEQKQMTPPSDMDLTHKTKYDQLSNTAGSEFDRVYIQGQVEDHTAVVNAFQNEISNGSDADVKAFAEKYLPTIQHHLEMARILQAQF
jgi:putative membrane protein